MRNNHQPLWTTNNLMTMAGSLVLQVILFYIAVNINHSGPLGGLVIFEWMGITFAAIVLHLVLFFIYKNRLYSTTLLMSLAFWALAWPLYFKWEKGSGSRERARISDEHFEWRDNFKKTMEPLLIKNGLLYHWSEDSLCYLINKPKGKPFCLTGSFTGGGDLRAFETLSARPSITDTAFWVNRLRQLLPFLNNKQLANLDQILKKKNYCIRDDSAYPNCTYSCYETFMYQVYRIKDSVFTTYLYYPDPNAP